THSAVGRKRHAGRAERAVHSAPSAPTQVPCRRASPDATSPSPVVSGRRGNGGPHKGFTECLGRNTRRTAHTCALPAAPELQGEGAPTTAEPRRASGRSESIPFPDREGG